MTLPVVYVSPTTSHIMGLHVPKTHHIVAVGCAAQSQISMFAARDYKHSGESPLYEQAFDQTAIHITGFRIKTVLDLGLAESRDCPDARA